MRKKKTEDEAALTPEASASRQRLTPADIQQAEFRLSMRGYNEREVDELLDRLTEDWGAVLEENKRLRDGVPVSSASSDVAVADAKREADAIIARARQDAAEIVRNASQATPAAAPADAAEAAAVSSFLNKERDFLQSLGRLVQGHAESVKSMAQGARAAESKPAARPAPAAQPDAKPDLAPKAEPAPAPKAQARTPEPAPKPAAPAQKAPQTAGAPTQPVVKIDASDEVPAQAPQAKAAEPRKARSASSPSAQASPQPAPAKQPAAIRIPEGGAPERAPASTPAPQGAERGGDPAQNRDEELSLRELFWGDE
jgi:DivIVA domain-containing protein